MSNLYTMPREESVAITTCSVTGPGKIKNFGVNGNLLFQQVNWKQTCVIAAGIGLVCDGRKRCNIGAQDFWGCESMNVWNAVVVNNIDPELLRLASAAQ